MLPDFRDADGAGSVEWHDRPNAQLQPLDVLTKGRDVRNLWRNRKNSHERLRVARLSRRFEELDRIAVRILDLDLLAARPGLHVVSKTNAGPLQRFDERLEIVHPQHD